MDRRATALGRAIAAEWSKTISLRVLPATMLGAIVAAALLGAVYAFGTVTDPMTGKITATSPTAAELVDAVLGAMTFLQVVAVLIGIFVIIPDVASPVIRTTLLAVPRRGILLGAKLIIASAAVALGATAAMLGGLCGAGIVGSIAFDNGPPLGSFVTEEILQRVAGAWLYLALIGMFAFGSALALRQLVPALIGLLSLVLILSPLLSAAPGVAKWLPDTAGSQLYLHDASAHHPFGGLVLAAWALVAIATGGLLFIRRDA
ncbi:hypothetical protein ACFOWY_06285 [Lysinibacter cavernae]|uniref:ABC transporter permease n=2 Tax=Lysinibacter cavernae TaxID=1640652 RepID=A0A7X5TSI7_9MICO|nr:hypothetical protein [Lysinibacter cavernae]NIH52449.1 hypothetical protein [Lysinibacter cavernae]